jgi:magnesium chelatase subunit I
VLIVYTANPEDYTNRGNIITPLRDRIASQIHTHYPPTIQDGIRITEQEAWTDRNGGPHVSIPQYFKEIVEYVAIQARKSEYIDQKSGVSARAPISCMENLVSNVERRNFTLKESEKFPRICDLDGIIPSIVGKIELVYEGEQEGAINVARLLIGQAVKEVFVRYFPKVHVKKSDAAESEAAYSRIKAWFAQGNKLHLSDLMPSDEYYSRLIAVPTLKQTAFKYLQLSDKNDRSEVSSAMEFILEGLHQHSVLSKEVNSHGRSYGDYVDNIFSSLGSAEREEDEEEY